jgi:WD40 repeat protein
VLIAMVAVRTKATPDALFALRAAIDSDPLQRLLPGVGAQTCPELGPTVVYDPSGTRVIEGTCDGSVRVVDRRTGQTVRTLHVNGPAVPIRISRDGSMLAVATDGGMRLYDARTLTPRRGLRMPGHAERIAFSRDGSLVGATGRDRTGRSWAMVWATAGGRLRLQLSSPPYHGGVALRGIAFIPGGRAVVVGRESGPATVVELGPGHRRHALAGTQRTSDLAVSADGRRLAVTNDQVLGSQANVGLVTVWDTRSWHRVAVVARAPGNAPSSVAFSPDGSRLAVGWYDGSAGVWSLSTSTRLAAFLGPAGPVSSVAYSRDGAQVVVAAADGSIRLWRAGAGESSYIETGSRNDVAFPGLANGRLTVLMPPNIVRTWRTSDLRVLRSVSLGRRVDYDNAWLSEDGRLAALWRANGDMEVWDVRAPRRLMTLRDRGGAVVAFARDDRRLAVLDGKRNAIVDLATGGVLPLRGRAEGCPRDWQMATFSRDGSVLVGGTLCGQSLAWNARTGAVANRLDVRGEIGGLAVAPGGEVVALASQDGRLTLWDRRTGARRVIGTSRGARSLAFSGDGGSLVSGGIDRTIRVIDVRSGRLLRTMRVQNPVYVRFGSDGRTLVSSELHGVIRLWRPCPHCGDARALLAEAQGIVTRNLTPSERQTYLSGF